MEYSLQLMCTSRALSVLENNIIWGNMVAGDSGLKLNAKDYRDAKCKKNFIDQFISLMISFY